MEDEFVDRYKINSVRLGNWDYSSPGVYFVTVCVFNGNKLLGRIDEGQMVLTNKGEIIKEELERTVIIRKNIRIDEWVIMPNHVHILLRIIEKDKIEMQRLRVETPRRGVSTEKRTYRASLKWKANSLGSIIGQFKSKCKKRMDKLHLFFGWQSSYYDEVIKDKEQYLKVKWYIRNNIKNWEKDKLYRK